jgi:hypothetical protein
MYMYVCVCVCVCVYIYIYIVGLAKAYWVCCVFSKVLFTGTLYSKC